MACSKPEGRRSVGGGAAAAAVLASSKFKFNGGGGPSGQVKCFSREVADGGCVANKSTVAGGAAVVPVSATRLAGG